MQKLKLISIMAVIVIAAIISSCKKENTTNNNNTTPTLFTTWKVTKIAGGNPGASNYTLTLKSDGTYTATGIAWEDADGVPSVYLSNDANGNFTTTSSGTTTSIKFNNDNDENYSYTLTATSLRFTPTGGARTNAVDFIKQ